jgi:hypothetical protein
MNGTDVYQGVFTLRNGLDPPHGLDLASEEARRSAYTRNKWKRLKIKLDILKVSEILESSTL